MKHNWMGEGMNHKLILQNLRKWKLHLESQIEGMSPEWPEIRRYQSQIDTLEASIDYIEGTEAENDELGRMLKEMGMREDEFLPGFLSRLTGNTSAS